MFYFKLNADKNNLLLFLIVTCALLRVMRHFLTFFIFVEKILFKTYCSDRSLFSFTVFLGSIARFGEGFIVSGFLDAEIFNHM